MDKKFMVTRQGKEFVLYAGLLDEAHRQGLNCITTTLIQAPSAENGQCAIVAASVLTTKGTFAGLGDASPENVSRMIAPHIIRMAETRAKARALRDAINVAVTALEELGPEGVEAEHSRPVPTRTLEPAGSVATMEDVRNAHDWFTKNTGGLTLQLPDSGTPQELARVVQSIKEMYAQATDRKHPADTATMALVRQQLNLLGEADRPVPFLSQLGATELLKLLKDRVVDEALLPF